MCMGEGGAACMGTYRGQSVGSFWSEITGGCEPPDNPEYYCPLEEPQGLLTTEPSVTFKQLSLSTPKCLKILDCT